MERPTLIKHLKPIIRSNTKVLDAGCGTGSLVKLLVDLGVRPKNILGNDISPYMLEIAQKSYPKVQFIEANLPELRLKSKSLNLVVSSMVLQFLNQRDFRITIQSFSKWLVRGGHLLFIVVHPLRFTSNYSEYFNYKAKSEGTPWGTKIKYYPKKLSDYLNVVINSGFVITSVEEPKPQGKEANIYPDEYKKYSTKPTRLVVMASKK